MPGASGATFLDRRLYLPECWFDEDHKTRWQDCQIPDETRFQTKHELAAVLVEKIMASGRLQAKSGCLRRADMAISGFRGPGWTRRGYGSLSEVPRDTKVWPLLETDGQTARARPSSWVHPQVPSRKGPAPRRERLHPSSPAKVPLEDLARQWPASHWQRFRLACGTQRSARRRVSRAPRYLAAGSVAWPRNLGGDPAQSQRISRRARMEVLASVMLRWRHPLLRLYA